MSFLFQELRIKTTQSQNNQTNTKTMKQCHHLVGETVRSLFFCIWYENAICVNTRTFHRWLAKCTTTSLSKLKPSSFKVELFLCGIRLTVNGKTLSMWRHSHLWKTAFIVVPSPFMVDIFLCDIITPFGTPFSMCTFTKYGWTLSIWHSDHLW